jgi:hypothetical protein
MGVWRGVAMNSLKPYAQHVHRNRLVDPQDLFGRSQIKLVKIYFHKKFQLKRTNGFRVMAFQSLAQNRHIWHLVLPWEIQKPCIVQHLLYYVLHKNKYSK